MHPVCVCCHWQWEVTSVYMTTSCSRTPKGRDESGHGSEGRAEEEGATVRMSSSWEGLKKMKWQIATNCPIRGGLVK